MCLLWLLLQFIVLVMYWDVPAVSSEEGGVLVEMKGEEPHEEEAPLMGPDEEPTPSYKAVGCSPAGEWPVGGPSAASSPFRNFSASRGETPKSPDWRNMFSRWQQLNCYIRFSRNTFRGKFGPQVKS